LLNTLTNKKTKPNTPVNLAFCLGDGYFKPIIMKPINFELIQKTVFKLLPYIGILILSTMIYFKMNENSKLKVEVKTHKEQAKVYVETAKGYVKESDELKKQVPKLKSDVTALEKNSRLKDSEIDLLKKKVKAKLDIVSTYNSNDIALYYQSRYNDKKGVVLTQYGVALVDTIAKRNISELTLFDGAKKELVLTNEKLSTTEKIVVLKDTIIANVEKQNDKLSLAIAENNKALYKKEEVIKDTEKMFRRERNKKNFWKVATTTVIAGASYLLLIQ